MLNERDPNEELGHILRTYQEHHPQGQDRLLSAAQGPCFPAKTKAGRAVYGPEPPDLE